MYCPVNGISKGFVHNCLETAAVIYTATQEIDGTPVVFLLQVQVWDLRHISRVMMRDALCPRWLLVFALLQLHCVKRKYLPNDAR